MQFALAKVLLAGWRAGCSLTKHHHHVRDIHFDDTKATFRRHNKLLARLPLGVILVEWRLPRGLSRRRKINEIFARNLRQLQVNEHADWISAKILLGKRNSRREHDLFLIEWAQIAMLPFPGPGWFHVWLILRENSFSSQTSWPGFRSLDKSLPKLCHYTL